MAGFQQIPATQILDGTIKDVDIASDATIAQSKIANLTAALAALQATLVSGSNIKTINGVSLLGSGDLTVGGGETLVTSVSSLTSINCSLGSFYLISLSASTTFSFANVTANKVYSFEITNTNTSDITITIPTGAVATNPTFTISPNTKRIFQMIYVNSVYDFEVGNMKGTV